MHTINVIPSLTTFSDTSFKVQIRFNRPVLDNPYNFIPTSNYMNTTNQ